MNMGDEFDMITATKNTLLCIDNYDGMLLLNTKNLQKTNYFSLRIYECNPENQVNITCENNQAKKNEFLNSL